MRSSFFTTSLIFFLCPHLSLGLGRFFNKFSRDMSTLNAAAATAPFALTGIKTAAGDAVEDVTTELKGKAVALYFSAHWCPPCRRFTPILKDFYEDVNSEEQVLEIIFVSSDDSEGAQQQYLKEAHGDWLVVGYDDPSREELKQRYGCFAGKEQGKWPSVSRRNGIPGLVVVTPDGGEVLFGDAACSAVERQGPAIVESWPKW